MLKNILKVKYNIIYFIGILGTLILIVSLYSGVKEGYFNIFLLAIIISPMLVALRPKNSLKVDLIFAVFIFLAIILYTIIFWKYKDGRLFNLTNISQISEEAGNQFSFENELKLGLLSTFGSISILISFLIRFVYLRFRIVKV